MTNFHPSQKSFRSDSDGFLFMAAAGVRGDGELLLLLKFKYEKHE
jgi:hypothetical protein